VTGEQHRKAWGGNGGTPAPRVRSDDSIGRPEDIGTHPAAKPTRTKAKPKPAPAAGKPVRITVDLDAARYTELNRWLAWAAVEASPDAKRISAAAAIRAMIDVITRDKDIGIVVVDQLRRDR
jgi:hypothetical protein